MIAAATRILTSAISVAAIGLAATVFAAPATAAPQVDSFDVTTSSTAAGGHPDLSTSFTLIGPGQPESARNVVFNAPEGLFGNPNAVTQCNASDFALDQCPPNSQVGLITVRANYAGNSDNLLGTAPIFSMTPGVDQTALFAFIVPTLGIPINIPVAVRTGSDYGLRFTVSEITQEAPLAGVDLTFWGFPADSEHDKERFAKGTPGSPAGCPGKADAGCIETPTKASIPVAPLIDNPTICTGQPLVASLELQSYQDPSGSVRVPAEYPATTGCEKEVFRPVLFASPTTNQTDSPSGLNVELSVAPVPHPRRRAVPDPLGDDHASSGLHDQP